MCFGAIRPHNKKLNIVGKKLMIFHGEGDTPPCRPNQCVYYEAGIIITLTDQPISLSFPLMRCQEKLGKIFTICCYLRLKPNVTTLLSLQISFQSLLSL